MWAAEANAAGGIHGRKIEIKEYDHGETADGGVAACKAIVADKAVYVPFEIQGAIAHLTAANCLDEAGVTNLVWQASDDFVGKWTHNACARDAEHSGSGHRPLHQVHDLADGQGRLRHRFGRHLQGPGRRHEGGSREARDRRRRYPIHRADGHHVRAAAAEHEGCWCDVVALATVASETTLLKEADSIGFHPKWTGNGYAHDYLPAGSLGVYNGVTATSLSKATDTPAFADYLKVAEKYAKAKCQVCAQQFLAYGQGKLLGAVLDALAPTSRRRRWRRRSPPSRRTTTACTRQSRGQLTAMRARKPCTRSSAAAPENAAERWRAVRQVRPMTLTGATVPSYACW